MFNRTSLTEEHTNTILGGQQNEKQSQLPRPMADTIEVGACKSSS